MLRGKVVLVWSFKCFCLFGQRAANMIPAHDSPLAALAFDASGTKLATASEKVTSVKHDRSLSKLYQVVSVCFLFKCLSLPPRAQSSVSSPSQRDRSSLNFGEASRGRRSERRHVDGVFLRVCRVF